MKYMVADAGKCLVRIGASGGLRTMLLNDLNRKRGLNLATVEAYNATTYWGQHVSAETECVVCPVECCEGRDNAYDLKKEDKDQED